MATHTAFRGRLVMPGIGSIGQGVHRTLAGEARVRVGRRGNGFRLNALRKLFIKAQAWISMSSTEKCSADSSAFTSSWFGTASMNAASPNGSRNGQSGGVADGRQKALFAGE